jgi:hypothetical protein
LSAILGYFAQTLTEQASGGRLGFLIGIESCRYAGWGRHLDAVIPANNRTDPGWLILVVEGAFVAPVAIV